MISILSNSTKASRSKIRVWSVAFWLILWQLASMAIGQQLIMVSPIQVVCRLSELIVTNGFWKSIANTSIRILLGFSLGVFFGIALAALSARFKTLEELFAPVLLAVKAVPVASFVILVLILFSSKNLAIIISLLMVLPVVYSNILGGIRAADYQLLEMATVFRIPLWKRLRYVYIPQVFPYFTSACASGLGMSWKSGVAAEVIGIPTGSIGEKLYEAKVYFDTPDLFAWTLVIVLVSLLFERVFNLILLALQAWMERLPE